MQEKSYAFVFKSKKGLSQLKKQLYIWEINFVLGNLYRSLKTSIVNINLLKYHSILFKE